MEDNKVVWGGLVAAGLLAAMALPWIAPKARLAVRRAVAISYRSPGGGGSAPTADPARGFPA